MKRILFSLFIFILVFCIFAYYSFVPHESYSRHEETFVIEKPYLLFVKSLATKNSLEKFVEDNNGILKHKHWEDFTVEIPKKILKIKEYKVEGNLDFTFEKNDPSLGNLILDFRQNVHVDKDQFSIRTGLKSSNESVLLCEKFINIVPLDSLKVKIYIKSELKIKKTILHFFRSFMDEKVNESVEDDLLRLKNNLIKISGDSSLVRFKLNSER